MSTSSGLISGFQDFGRQDGPVCGQRLLYTDARTSERDAVSLAGPQTCESGFRENKVFVASQCFCGPRRPNCFGRIGFATPRKYGRMIKTLFHSGGKALCQHRNTVSVLNRISVGAQSQFFRASRHPIGAWCNHTMEVLNLKGIPLLGPWLHDGYESETLKILSCV